MREKGINKKIMRKMYRNIRGSGRNMGSREEQGGSAFFIQPQC